MSHPTPQPQPDVTPGVPAPPRLPADAVLETTVTELEIPVCPGVRNACLVHIYPRGPGMGARYPLADVPLVIGRGPECEIRIDEYSVSRRHARIQPAPDGYFAEDLQSTNGTMVNDEPVARRMLRDGDYLRTGNCIFRYLVGGNVESAYHEEIYRLTIIDALTGIHNKRYLVEFLDRELSRSSRYGRPLSLILFDIDHFKGINDVFGHLAGDFTLRELATRVKTVVRTEELFARYGGEEFAVVLPEAPRESAMQLAERIRTLLAEHSFRFGDSALRITVSLGVTTTSGESELTAVELLQRADKNLYQAKHEGRNRVIG